MIENILMVLLGWALGFGSTLAVQAIRSNSQRRQLARLVSIEINRNLKVLSSALARADFSKIPRASLLDPRTKFLQDTFVSDEVYRSTLQQLGKLEISKLSTIHDFYSHLRFIQMAINQYNDGETTAEMRMSWLKDAQEEAKTIIESFADLPDTLT